jgi:hypothetical protein
VQFCNRCKADSERKTVRGGRAEAPVPRKDLSFHSDQKTGNFKESFVSRPMQQSLFPEENQKNQLTQKEFCFKKNEWQRKITFHLGGERSFYQR